MGFESDGYGRTWTAETDSDYPTRIRFGLTTIDGRPIRFLVQLEYRHGDDDWRPVARFDHERGGPPYRNVTISGLHLDVYDPNGVQRFKRTDFDPIEEKAAMGAAETYLNVHHERLVSRYEGWL